MDGDPVLGSAAQRSATSIRTLLQDVKRTEHCQLKLTSLHSAANNTQQQPTPTRIRQWFNNITPHWNTVIFVYYIGSGRANANRQLYLNLPRGEFYRQELVKSMQRSPAHLKILITDADSYGPSVTDSTTFGKLSVRRSNLDISTTLAHLFVQHIGFLNLTAATEGEPAWTDDDKGSFFTHSLVDAIYNFGDLDGNRFASWTEVFELTRQGTMDLFKTMPLAPQIRGEFQRRGIKSQRPKYYGELPQRF